MIFIFDCALKSEIIYTFSTSPLKKRKKIEKITQKIGWIYF